MNKHMNIEIHVNSCTYIVTSIDYNDNYKELFFYITHDIIYRYTSTNKMFPLVTIQDIIEDITNGICHE